DLPVVGGSRLTNGAIHVARPGVVRGHGEIPVVVLFVQLAQIPSRRARRLLRIQSLVYLTVAAQSQISRRAGHELPESNRAGVRPSVVAEAALHVRDESEVLRNSLLAEDLPDARHVSARTLQALLE